MTYPEDKFNYQPGELIFITPCAGCKHKGPGPFCKAFPVEIPDEILSGENKHLEPLPGQGNRIVFEPR